MLRRARPAFACVALAACGAGEGPAGASSAGVGGDATSAEASATSASVAASGASSAASSSTTSTGIVEPEFAAVPWEAGDDVGFGVARKDTENPRGDGVFVGYAGYGITAESARAWVAELYGALLRDRGYRYVYAVQGPADAYYADLEIGNSKIASALQVQVSASTRAVLVVAHSSGSYVAHELLRQLAGDGDPSGVTEGRVVYFNLDGGAGGLDQATVARTRRTYFVAAADPTTGTSSPNKPGMAYGASVYSEAGGYLELDASASGCDAGAAWCVHMTPITRAPHDEDGGAFDADYADFTSSAVTTAYLEAKADEAGL